MATKWCVDTNFPFWTAPILEMLANVSFSFLFLCADPQRLEDGVYRMYNLHHNLERDPSKLPNYVVNRGTNVVESAHSVFHKLLPGGNNSPEHFDTVMTQRAGRLSADASLKFGVLSNYGHYNFPRLLAIDRARARLKMPPQFADVPNPSKTTELFGFEWKKDGLFKRG